MAGRSKYSQKVRERAVRMVFAHGGDYPSQWAAMRSIAGKIGCTPVALRKWVQQAEIDSGRQNPRREFSAAEAPAAAGSGFRRGAGGG